MMKMRNSELSEKQRLLAEAKARGLTDLEACKAAGYTAKTHKSASNQVTRMRENEGFRAYLSSLMEESTTNAVKSAQDVKEQLSGLMDLAAANEDFSGYTQMANRLAKMSGHDEPERQKIEFEVNIGGSSEG